MASVVFRLRRIGAIGALVLAVAACSTASTTPAQAQIGGSKQLIGMKSLKFTPNKVTIAKTTTLVFVWKESVAHNIVFDKVGDVKGPKSPTLNKGDWSPDKTWYAKAGTYKYKCTLHPGMNGQVTVK
jgi:plastocyanin